MKGKTRKKIAFIPWLGFVLSQGKVGEGGRIRKGQYGLNRIDALVEKVKVESVGAVHVVIESPGDHSRAIGSKIEC